MDTTDRRTPGQELEYSIAVWIQDLVSEPAAAYVWPGTWPDQDLWDMSRCLPGWHYDSAWIYYQQADPHSAQAVQEFNSQQDRYVAVIIDRAGVYAPPRDIIAVFDRQCCAAIQMAMWLRLGENSRKELK